MSNSRTHLDVAGHIARAAKRAQEQTTEADRRVDFIEELASRARSEADKMHDISHQLSAIARSVAMVAIDACQRPEETDAQRNGTDLPIDIDDLLQLLDGKLKEQRGLNVGLRTNYDGCSAITGNLRYEKRRGYERYADRQDSHPIRTPSPSPNSVYDGSGNSYANQNVYANSTFPVADCAVHPYISPIKHTNSLRDCIRKVDELTEQYASRIPEFRTVDYVDDPFCEENTRGNATMYRATSAHQQSYALGYGQAIHSQPCPYHDHANDMQIQHNTTEHYEPPPESGFSSADNEVQTILRDKRARELNITKREDRTADTSAKWTRRASPRERSVSPLLSSEEQEMYTVQVDRGRNSASPKHIFTPIVSTSGASLNDLPNDDETDREGDGDEAVNQRISDVT